MKQCTSFRRYKGILRPRCNDGKQCEGCRATWYKRHPAACALTEVQVIQAAIKVDDHFDRLAALEAWNEGDWKRMHDIFDNADQRS